MRPSYRFVWATLGSLAIVGAIGIGYVVYVFWPHCDRLETVLATQLNGRSVVSCFEACTSLGTTVNESIELRLATGDRKTIFEYTPNGGIVGCRGRTFPSNQELAVDWSDPGVIRISISVVSAISKKRDAVDGVRLIYDIGTLPSKLAEGTLSLPV